MQVMDSEETDSTPPKRGPYSYHYDPRLDEAYRYDPHYHRNTDNPISNFEAFVSVIKCTLGVGCLAMPMAFHRVGWLNGIISTAVIGCIIIYALHVLIDNIYVLCKQHRRPHLSYPEAMGLGLLEGPEWIRIFSFPVKLLTGYFMALYHFGVCAVYVVFIAENIAQVARSFGLLLDLRIYMGLLIIPLIIIYLVRDIKRLVPYSAFANILLFIGLGIVLYYVLQDLPPLTERVRVQDFTYYPIFYGTILFAMESVGVIVAIEAIMEHPKDYLGITGVLNRGMLFVLTLYGVVGFLGYWCYGDSVKGSITLNLPTDALSLTAKLLFAIAIYITYTLQGYIIFDVVWHRCLDNTLPRNFQYLMEYVVRIVIVLLSVLVAILYNNLGAILALVGSFCLSILGPIFPAILDLCVHYKTGYGRSNIYFIRDLMLIIFGVVGGIEGTRTALTELMSGDDELLWR